jgi:8-oxo-dGTP diphosphatase
MSDFKFNPGLPHEGSNENSFYTNPTLGNKSTSLQQKKKDVETAKHAFTVKTKTGGAAVINSAAINHRISMCSVIFGYEEDELKILLVDTDTVNGVEFGNDNRVLPGCLATANQTLENSAREMIEELTGAENFFIEQVYSFGNPARGGEAEAAGSGTLPDTWEITVAFFALVKIPEGISYSSYVNGAKWYSITEAAALSPYQNKIVEKALATLRFEIRHFPIAFELLPEKFTLAQVQSLYQAISGKKLDKRNFRKKLKALNLVSPAGEKIKNVIARPSELFVFNRNIYSDSHNSIL